MTNPAIKFTFYELFKRRYTAVSGRQVSGVSAFILGCLATAIATLFTYPLQMVQVYSTLTSSHITVIMTFQAQARHGNHSGGIAEIGAEIVYQNGVLGLFRGLQSKLLQSVTAAGFMFMSYENIFQLVNTLMGLQATVATKSVKTS